MYYSTAVLVLALASTGTVVPVPVRRSGGYLQYRVVHTGTIIELLVVPVTGTFLQLSTTVPTCSY